MNNAKATNCRLAKADRTHHKFTFSLEVFCFCFFSLYAQWVFAAADIYIYKDKNGVLSFTSAPTHGEHPRVILSENRPETSTQTSQVESKSTFVRFFRLKDTDEIGYWDGEKFIPLWPEKYTKLINDDTAFANLNDYEDIWVNGLSEQAGLIKIRKGLPLAVTVAAIDWLIEQNLDKYKARIISQSNQPRTTPFIIAFVILLASLPILFFSHRYKNWQQFLFSWARRCISTHCLIAVAIVKRARRMTAEFVMNAKIRLDTEKAKSRERERQEQERRTGSDKNSERESAAGENGFDPYQVLRVTKDASKDDIKAAYLDLIKQYHPDKVSHLGQEFQKLADEKAQLINRAYQILMAS